MTTLIPREPYTDAELASLYPPTLELQLVQVLLRHGERTPVGPRFQNTGLHPFWPYCKAARHLRSAILDPDSGTFSSLEWKRRLETFGKDDVPMIAAGPKGELDSLCDMGMLTDRGRETTTLLGRRLRHLYVDRLGFIPPTLSPASEDNFYLRSTPIPRALESLQQTLHGLYPPHTRSPDLPALTILGRTPGDETLFPNDSNCRRFAALSRAFAQRTATHWNNTEAMAHLTKKLGKWTEGPVAVDGKPRLSGIMDTINSTAAHGPATKLPKEFYDPKVKAIMENIAVEEWYSGYRESQEYRTLGIGGLLGDVVARMVSSTEHPTADSLQKTKAPPQIRFGLSGCHDTTLAGALSSLGAFGHDAWPPFTSHIAIELFRLNTIPTPNPPRSWLPSILSSKPDKPTPGIGRKKTPDLSSGEKKRLEGYFVRLRYNDEPVTIPGCAKPGNHLEGDESFCTLAAFKSIVDKFTPTDWKKQCRANVTAPVFPSKPEPAGY